MVKMSPELLVTCQRSAAAWLSTPVIRGWDLSSECELFGLFMNVPEGTAGILKEGGDHVWGAFPSMNPCALISSAKKAGLRWSQGRACGSAPRGSRAWPLVSGYEDRVDTPLQ